MKKICFILPKYAPENVGGAELQVYYLAKELFKKNFEVHYIREGKSGEVKKEGIILHSIPKHKYFFFQFFSLSFLWKQMQKIKADCWYVRVSMWNLTMVNFISKFLGGKVVWACSHDREVSAFASRTNSRVKFFFERIEHFFFIKALKKADIRLVQTNRQQLLLKKNYHLDSIILQNSHPIPTIKNLQRQNNVLWIANMRDFKRPGLFIDLAKQLCALKIKCLMIGAANSEHLKISLINTEQELLNFKYLQVLTVEKVYEQLQVAKVLVNTSAEEGFPNTFIQAWLSGVPVVTLGVDPADIIKNNKVGKVTSSVEEMKNFIKHIVYDENLWSEYSERSKKYAEEHFNINAYVKSFINITGIE